MATTKVLVLTEQLDRKTRTYTRNIVYKEVLGEDTITSMFEISKFQIIYKWNVSNYTSISLYVFVGSGH